MGFGSSERVDPEVRITLESDSRTTGDFRPWFARKIRSLVPEVLARLRLEGIGRYRIELGMRGYHTGGLYRTHRDAGAASHHSRKLSFVYCFRRQPGRFSGGDLLLYDTDADTSSRPRRVYGKPSST